MLKAPVLVLILLVTSTTAWGEQVLTIYFCGTANTIKGPDKGWGGQNRAHELISWLYATDKSDPVLNNKPKIQATHHKIILDGVGTHGHTLNLLFPNLPGRGWREIENEAIAALKAVHGSHQKQDVILNLVGFSRGAVLTMRMANWVTDQQKGTALEKKIKRINIIAFDPVPLSLLFDYKYICLGEKVERYVGFYAVHENTDMFYPAIPDFKSEKTKSRMFRLPGKHETMVGNPEVDGSASNPNKEWDPFLLRVSWVARVMAVELLESPQWGHVTFDFTKEYFSNTKINPNAFNWDRDEKTFKKQVHSIWYFGDQYTHMKDTRTADIPPGMGYQVVRFKHNSKQLECAFISQSVWEKDYKGKDNDRCCMRMKCGVWRREGHALSYQSDIPKITGQNAWRALVELGGPDSDNDRTEDSLDNCPKEFNPDQVDCNNNGIGDVCDSNKCPSPPVPPGFKIIR